MKALSLLVLSLVLVHGCQSNTQSGEAMYVQNMALMPYGDWRLDVYHGAGAPNDNKWLNQGFIFGIKMLDIEKDIFRQSNVRVDACVDWHASFTGYAGADIHDGLDGRGYIGFTTGVTGEYEEDGKQWISTRTNANGETYLIGGCGDPGFNSDPGHTGNPELFIYEDDMISTLVQYTLKISRASGGPIIAHCWAVHVKSEYQHFYNNGLPGVYDISYCGVGEWSEGAVAGGSMALGEGEGIELFVPSSPPIPNRSYPTFTAAASDPNEPGDPNEPASPTWELNDSYWLQLICIPSDGWYWIDTYPFSWAVTNFGPDELPWQDDEPMPGVDPNSPNAGLQKIIDDVQPVAHFMDVSFSESVAPDQATAVLRVLPHKPGFWPDPNYWPESDPARFADTSKDGRVDLGDLALISQAWYAVDPNVIPTNIDDLVLLSQYWLVDNSEYLFDPNDIGQAIYSRVFGYQTVATTDGGCRHLLATPLIFFVDDERFEGYYRDSWYNPVYAAYVPEGCILDIRPVVNGDFTGDGIANLLDWAYFAKAWRTGTYDPALDKNTDGVVDNADLQEWIKEWLR